MKKLNYKSVYRQSHIPDISNSLVIETENDPMDNGEIQMKFYIDSDGASRVQMLQPCGVTFDLDFWGQRREKAYAKCRYVVEMLKQGRKVKGVGNAEVFRLNLAAVKAVTEEEMIVHNYQIYWTH